MWCAQLRASKINKSRNSPSHDESSMAVNFLLPEHPTRDKFRDHGNWKRFWQTERECPMLVRDTKNEIQVSKD